MLAKQKDVRHHLKHRKRILTTYNAPDSVMAEHAMATDHIINRTNTNPRKPNTQIQSTEIKACCHTPTTVYYHLNCHYSISLMKIAVKQLKR